jgi:cell division septal protein FtsQ
VKKIILLSAFVILVIFLLAYPVFVLEKNVGISSNVPIETDGILRKIGIFYLGILPKKDVQVERSPFKLKIVYNEKTLINVRFKDGEYGLTENGFLISKSESGLPLAIANFSHSSYNKEIGDLFLYFKNKDLLDVVKSFEIFDKSIAFVDKNGIFVIMGKGDYDLKMKEYFKTTEIVFKDLKKVEKIDLRFNLQAVIKWRENG